MSVALNRALNLQVSLPEYIYRQISLPITNKKVFSFITMSQHPSLKPPGGLSKKRNVLKRFQRIDLLRQRNQWKEGDRVVSLPKTKPEE